MTNLSDAAYAVFTAYNREASGKPDDHHMLEAIAAALRALDSQLGYEVLGVRCVDCSQIQLIADELEEFGNR
jgi:hypothetical protein